jgi:hypothetical protein
MSYKPVVTTGNDPKWYDNALRFETKEEALFSARDLMNRWMLVTNYDAQYSDDPVNYKIDMDTGVMTAVKPDIEGHPV